MACDRDGRTWRHSLSPLDFVTFKMFDGISSRRWHRASERERRFRFSSLHSRAFSGSAPSPPPVCISISFRLSFRPTGGRRPSDVPYPSNLMSCLDCLGNFVGAPCLPEKERKLNLEKTVNRYFASFHEFIQKGKTFICQIVI